MLVVSRKQKETVVITVQEDIEIVVSVERISGDKVRLGIEGDKKLVHIRRGELEPFEQEQAIHNE